MTCQTHYTATRRDLMKSMEGHRHSQPGAGFCDQMKLREARSCSCVFLYLWRRLVFGSESRSRAEPPLKSSRCRCDRRGTETTVQTGHGAHGWRKTHSGMTHEGGVFCLFFYCLKEHTKYQVNNSKNNLNTIQEVQIAAQQQQQQQQQKK